MEGSMQVNRRRFTGQFTVLGAFIATMTHSALLTAAELNNPVESPILVVAGKITLTNKGQRAVFDRPMLDAMSGTKIRTTTPWYTGEVEYEGVLFSRLLTEIGATGDKLQITALDDYSREIDIADLTTHQAILALKRNGEYMPVSDKGPLAVIYPYDSAPELKNEKYYSRSVWQVRRIEVR
jgi:hypothetical protein